MKIRTILIGIILFFGYGQAHAENLFHFGVRLEVNLVEQRPQWQTALLGFQAGMAFQIGQSSTMIGFRFSATGNPDTLKFRLAADVFFHQLNPNQKAFLYYGLGYANARVVAATYSDIYALLGLQLPLGFFVESTLGLGVTEALNFSTFPPKTVSVGPFLTFQLVFGFWFR
jgi:hypothetical protein